MELPEDVIGPWALFKEWAAGHAFTLFLKWTTPYQFNACMEYLGVAAANATDDNSNQGVKTMLKTTLTAALLVSTTAFGAPFNIDLTLNGLGDLSPSTTFTAPGVTVGVTAFGPNNPHVVAERAGPDDTGIGESNSGDNEVTSGSYLEFTHAGAVTLGMTFSSLLPHDTYAIYGGPGLGTLLLTGSVETPVDLTPFLVTYADFDFTMLPQQPADSNDTGLVATVFGTTAVPEPSSFGIIAAALLALGLLRRRA